jgi:hypothetical protein
VGEQGKTQPPAHRVAISMSKHHHHHTEGS